jgi:hypothetical protein
MKLLKQIFSKRAKEKAEGFFAKVLISLLAATLL